MITFKHEGDFEKTSRFFKRISEEEYLDGLDSLAREGVAALAAATPKDTGKTSESWDYEIVRENGAYKIIWTNSNVNKNVNIAVILQYGHGTRNGGYVQGRDYINPAIRPIFDRIAENAWEKVIRD